MATKKRDKFIEKEGKEKQGFEFKPIYIIPVLLIIGGIVFFVVGGSGPEKAEDIGSVNTRNPGTGNSGNTKTDPNNFYIPISKINDGKAHFYKYSSQTGKTVKFFVLKSRDGIFRAAFDACDVCFEAKKGYRQEGDYMVCNNCGMKFSSTRINEEKGGCNPAPLERHIEDGYLAIKKSDIEKGARYF